MDQPKEANHRKKDPKLKAKLKAESSGILAWLVRGCLKWQEDGLKIPEKIKVATQEYRESQDVLTDFIEECCIVAEPMKKYRVETKAGELYNAYKNWALENSRKVMSNKTFGDRFSRKFEKELKREGTIYYGILLKI